MPILRILIHEGCPSSAAAEALAEDIQQRFPSYEIHLTTVTYAEAKAIGLLTLPSVILEDKIMATGIPQVDWLAKQLREREAGPPRSRLWDEQPR